MDLAKSKSAGMFLTAGVMLGGALQIASATPVSVTVPNYSFEDPRVPTGQPVSTSTADWTLDGNGTLIPVTLPGNPPINIIVPGGTGVFPNPATPGPTDPPDGHLNGSDPSIPPGSPDVYSQIAYIFSNVGNSITQALVNPMTSSPETFVSGAQYTLTVSLANATSKPVGTDRLALELYYVDSSNVTHIVLENDVTASQLNQQSLVDFSKQSAAISAAAAGQQINIGIVPLDNGGGEFDLDNVRLSYVPEPASLGILGAAGVFLTARRRRSTVR